MIREWQPDTEFHNFGDHLIRLIGERIFTDAAWSTLTADPRHEYILLGSCIHDYTIGNVIADGHIPVLIGCGYRGEILSSPLIRKARIFSCRGFRTFQALLEQGMLVDIVGDPAMILPVVVPKAWRRCGKVLFVPHVCDAQRDGYEARDVGCDLVIQPETRNLDELLKMVRTISSARFVLAGSMHAAIVAHAYDVPFAFYGKSSGYIDCPPKWDDWLTSVSRPFVKAEFFSTAEDGRRWYEKYRGSFYRNPYTPVLDAYANIGQIKRWVAIKASFYDAIHVVTKIVTTQPGLRITETTAGLPNDVEYFPAAGSDLFTRRRRRSPDEL